MDSVGGSIERYMDLVSARQKLVASNIANADTPGYKTQDLNFEQEFRSLIQGAKPNVIEVPGLEVKHDGNNVNIDRETRLLAENTLRFSIASNLLRVQIRTIRAAIQEKSG